MFNTDYSIIVTIHNKGWLVERCIKAIKEHTTGDYELVLVFDGCTDNSEQVAFQAITNCQMPKYKIVYTPDVFETKANIAGIRSSEGTYCVIVQDDMVVNEAGWNERLTKPVIAFPDVFAVTANTAHNFKLNPRSKHINMSENLDYCWCDILDYDSVIDKKRGLLRDTFAIRDSVNRGPLLLVHDRLMQVGGLDETFAPQNMDDHDLCYRAYEQFGWVAGAYWIDYINPSEWASTRTDDPFLTPRWLYKAHHKNTKIVWSRHKDLILGNGHGENRKLP